MVFLMGRGTAQNGSKRLFLCEKRLKEEGFAKQTQVMLLEGWSADDVTAEAYPVSIKLETLLRRYSWEKVLQNYSRISYGMDGRSMSPNHEAINGSAACTMVSSFSL
jgi:hypothetical protein